MQKKEADITTAKLQISSFTVLLVLYCSPAYFFQPSFSDFSREKIVQGKDNEHEIMLCTVSSGQTRKEKDSGTIRLGR